MPIGIIVNVLSVAAGGFTGAIVKDKLKEQYKENLSMIFGIASMGMGITGIVLMQNMPAVILALIIGTIIGLYLNLGKQIEITAGKLQTMIGTMSDDNSAQLITVIVLFCASGTGIYGSLVSGMNGDHSILIAKSILDFFTAMIFACTLGKSVAAIAFPQGIIMLALYASAGFIVPVISPVMINDFKACGGFIMVATGFRILKLRLFPTADMIPAMVLVMPFSWLWTVIIMSCI